MAHLLLDVALNWRFYHDATVKKLILGLSVATLASVASHAGLIGSTVNGALTTSNTGSANQFSSSSAIVSTLLPEFSYVNTLTMSSGTVDLTASQLTLNVYTLFQSPSLKITLTDPSFAGLVLQETADSFSAGASAILSGTTITITVPAFQKLMGTSSAQFSLTTGSPARVPDGGSTLAMIIGGFGLLAAGRVRKN